MASLKSISTEHNIVLRGDFNPKILQPYWFSYHELLKTKEAEDANIKVVHPEIVEFTSSWLRIQVTRERFLVGTLQEPYYEILRDLVLGTFQLLRHTPLTQMGININMIYSCENEDQWHAIGDKVAPKDNWKDIIKSPGLRDIQMQGIREGNYSGYILINVAPTNETPYGITFRVNDHYEIKNPDKKVKGSKEILEILESEWKNSLDNSKEMVAKLINL